MTIVAIFENGHSAVLKRLLAMFAFCADFIFSLCKMTCQIPDLQRMLSVYIYKLTNINTSIIKIPIKTVVTQKGHSPKPSCPIQTIDSKMLDHERSWFLKNRSTAVE